MKLESIVAIAALRARAGDPEFALGDAIVPLNVA